MYVYTFESRAIIAVKL